MRVTSETMSYRSSGERATTIDSECLRVSIGTVCLLAAGSRTCLANLVCRSTESHRTTDSRVATPPNRRSAPGSGRTATHRQSHPPRHAYGPRPTCRGDGFRCLAAYHSQDVAVRTREMATNGRRGAAPGANPCASPRRRGSPGRSWFGIRRRADRRRRRAPTTRRAPRR